MSITTRVIAVCGGVLMASSVAAQAPGQPSPRLVSAKTLNCSFTAMASGTWKEGAPVTSTKPAKLAIQFNAVDTQDGTAEAVGDQGKSQITVRVVAGYLHLMQMDPFGALYVTTVLSVESTGGRLLATHSRHEYTPVQLPGLTSRPEQYYGDCAVTP
jgi:hypothetical protein